MGRAFEFRKGRKMKRWDRMAKAFTRLGKEIAIAVKTGGPVPETNPRLRVAVQNAKGVNMPKDRIEAAIKRASSKDEKNFDEIVYEGYGQFGVAILAECATDNSTRTVANLRMYFSKGNGALGKTGSLDFIFDRKGVFTLAPDKINIEDMELELIDFGLEAIEQDDEGIYIYTKFEDYGAMQKALEERNINIISQELQRIPNTLVELDEAQEEAVMKLVDMIEEDDDVQAVYHNIK
jgi:YebC/PmpR family DNA-binding regulatory protein